MKKKRNRATTITLKRTIGGRTVSAVIPARWEPEVNDLVATAESAQAGELAIAVELARSGPIHGEAFSWLRRSLGLSARKLAEILGVRHETISRWENGAAEVDRAAWLVLGDLILDRAGAHIPMMERAERIASRKRPPARTVVEVRP
jgi:DNA-binding transcriptional regulator YiaG